MSIKQAATRAFGKIPSGAYRKFQAAYINSKFPVVRTPQEPKLVLIPSLNGMVVSEFNKFRTEWWLMKAPREEETVDLKFSVSALMPTMSSPKGRSRNLRAVFYISTPQAETMGSRSNIRHHRRK